jgi:hypothetical protein
MASNQNQFSKFKREVNFWVNQSDFHIDSMELISGGKGHHGKIRYDINGYITHRPFVAGNIGKHDAKQQVRQLRNAYTLFLQEQKNVSQK